MPADTSIYSNIALPDMVGSYQRGNKWRQEQDALMKQQEIEAAKKGLFQMGPDGKLSVSQDGMQKFAQAAPDQAFGVQRQIEQDMMARDKAAFEQRAKQRELGILEGKANKEGTAKITEAATNLRKELTGLPVTKATQEVSAAYNKVQNASSDPSAAGDLALIFNYMKMLDPGSVVREGEFANAQNAAGIPVQVRNMYNKAISGERLAPQQRGDFVKQAGGVYQAQLDLQNQVNKQYAGYAQQFGIPADQVVVNFEANKPKPKGPPPLTPEDIGKMSREEKLAEALRRGLLNPEPKQVAGAPMSRPPGAM